jgi:WD40 repeat protein
MSATIESSGTYTSEIEETFSESFHVSTRFQVQHESQSNVFAARFSPDIYLTAVSYGDGSLRIYDTITGELAYFP